MSIQRIAIIGAGQMGSGIAHVFALAGCDVLLNDVSVDRIETGIASITGNLNRQAAKSKITEAERQALHSGNGQHGPTTKPSDA